jgi:methyl-accepting chemotaxis protein
MTYEKRSVATNSSFAELFSDETRVKAKRGVRIVEALAVSAILLTSGAVGGYWIRDVQAVARRQEMLEEHQAELKRTTDAYTNTLGYITRSMAQTAVTVGNAAETAESAANTAESASRTAKTAVQQATRAVDKAGHVPEPTRAQINSKVREANRALESK